MPLADERVENDRIAKLHQIPLVPTDTFRKSKFDVAFRSKTPAWTQEISRLMAEELKKRGAFDTAVFVKTAEDAQGYPVVVRGVLRLAEQRGRGYSYGFSFLMKYLWYLGLPKMSYHWKVEAVFQAYDTVENKQLWESKPIELASGTRVATIYQDEYNIDKANEAFQRLVEVGAAEIQNGLPAPTAALWADLSRRHQQKMNAVKMESELAQRTLPPELLFSKPRSGDRVRQARIEAAWNARAVAGLKEVKMTLNGKPVALQTVEQALAASTDPKEAPRSFAESTLLDLDLGNNVIRLSLRDHLDQPLNREVEIVRLPERLYEGRRYAIVVGLSQYQGKGLPGGLPGEKHAEAFAAYLGDEYGGQIPASDITLLTGSKATSAAVKEAIANAVRDALSGDSIIIYFSGYSLAVDSRGPGFLLTADADLDNLVGTAVSLDNLRDMLADALAANTVLFVDAAWPLEPYELHAQELLGNLTRRLRSAAVIASSARGAEHTPIPGPAVMSFGEVLNRLLNDKSADLNGDNTVTMRELVDKLLEESDQLGLTMPMEAGRYDRDMGVKKLE